MEFRLLKYIIYGLLLLFLFHFETLSFGPFKISHLWKGILLFYLLIKVFRYRHKIINIYTPLLFLAFLQLLNVELVNNPFNAILLFGTTLILPLLGIYCLQFSEIQIKKSLLFFASFFILSFVPYEIGFLKSLEEGYALGGYGVEAIGIIGPFQTVHSASTALAGSFIVILYFWFSNSYNRIYLTVMLLLCCYFLVFTYVRTGMLMAIIGAIPIILFYANKDSSMRFKLVLIGGLFTVFISSWVVSNETLLDRISGQRSAIGASETQSFETLGSGRGGIYLDALEIFVEANFYEKIVGMGQSEEKNRMEIKRGIALIPHNGFLFILLNNGILGFLSFIFFLRKAYRLQKYLNSEKKYLIKGLFLAYIVMTFFQNFDMLYMYLILVLGISYLIIINDRKENSSLIL